MPEVGPRLLLQLAAVMALTVTSGCWLQVGATGGHTRHNAVESALDATNVAGLREVWSADLTGQVSEPIVWKGRVFVTQTTTTGVAVHALDLDDGGTLWSRSLLGGVGGEGTFVVGTPVTVVDDLLWTGHLGYVPFAPGGGPACVSGADVLDPETGAGDGGAGDYPSAAASAGDIVARTLLRLGSGCASPSLQLDVRVAPTGGPVTRWTADLGAVSSGSLAPTAAGDQVFVAVGADLLAYAAAGCGAATCAPTWSKTFPTSSPGAMAGTTGPVFVIADSALIALDRAAGTELWRAPFADSVVGGTALADGVVYVTVTPSGGAPSLVALDAAGCGAATCIALWTAALSGTGATAPAVAGDVVYVSTTTGVEAVAAGGCGAATCPSLVSVPLPGAGTLSVAQRHVVVASTGRLTALALG